MEKRMMTVKRANERVVFNGAVVFCFVLMVFFLIFTFVSLEYNSRARSIPLTLGLLGSLMMFIQLISEAFPGAGIFHKIVHQESLLDKADTPTAEEEKDKAKLIKENVSPSKKNDLRSKEWVQVLRLVLWMTGFIVLLALVDYLLAVAAFVFWVTKIEARESWVRSISLSICVTLGFYLLFDVVLNSQL